MKRISGLLAALTVSIAPTLWAEAQAARTLLNVSYDPTRERGDPVQVEISQERFRELCLTKDAEVFITPKGKEILIDKYSI